MVIISLVESAFWITVLSVSCIAAVISMGLYAIWKHRGLSDRDDFDGREEL